MQRRLVKNGIQQVFESKVEESLPAKFLHGFFIIELPVKLRPDGVSSCENIWFENYTT